MNGIEREVDRLGRIVIPIEYRKQLGLSSGSKVIFFCDENRLVVEVAESTCALCGDHLDEKTEIRLCGACLARIRGQGK